MNYLRMFVHLHSRQLYKLRGFLPRSMNYFVLYLDEIRAKIIRQMNPSGSLRVCPVSGESSDAVCGGGSELLLAYTDRWERDCHNSRG